MGVVFQDYSLFPHMTVAENVAFPLQMRNLPKSEITARVTRALDRVRLGHLGDRKPAQLSGGQKQRVALTRALMFEPSVILMDEPLRALDKQLREEMQLEIRELHRKLGLTIAFVTHDQSEALNMSDRVAIFDKGRIAQIGTASEVYDCPNSRFVAQFIGETNLIEGHANAGQVTLPAGIALRADDPGAQGSVALSIRPERLHLAPVMPTENSFAARFDDVVYHGDHLQVRLMAYGLPLVARAARGGPDWQTGAMVQVGVHAQDCRVLAS